MHRWKLCMSSPCPASHPCASPATDRLCRCVVSCAQGVSSPFPLWRSFRPQCRIGETEVEVGRESWCRERGRPGRETGERRGRVGGESGESRRRERGRPSGETERSQDVQVFVIGTRGGRLPRRMIETPQRNREERRGARTALTSMRSCWIKRRWWRGVHRRTEARRESAARRSRDQSETNEQRAVDV